VAKRKGSIYLPGKEVDFWQKHRFNQEDKFFIGGYIPGSQGIGELLIGEFTPDGKFYSPKGLFLASTNSIAEKFTTAFKT
jgi:ATP-dependent DNA ligase